MFKKYLLNSPLKLFVLFAMIFSAKSFAAVSAPPEKLACAYFDQDGEHDMMGPIHARMLENVLGAFKGWNVSRRAVKDYAAGQLAGCDVVFYIATNFKVKTPPAFLPEAVKFSQTKTLVWMNYNFDKFFAAYNAQAAALGQPGMAFNAPLLNQPIDTPSPVMEDPGFYRYFDYKGETFQKLAKWDKGANRFMSSPELAMVQVIDPDRTHVLTTARHSRTNDSTPYIVRQDQGTGSIWYIADSPFTFIHYEDRYLIFCDLLWDILREKAPSGPVGALVRIEDLNPSQDSGDVRWAMEYLASQKVPFSVAMIPFYTNVFGVRDAAEDTSRLVIKPAYEWKEFLGTIRYAQALGANFVMHGVYHEAGEMISGYDGYSAADYEFWQYPEDRPLPQDSSDYLIGQLEKGEGVFQKLGIRPVAWEVPHYAASALDNVLFGKLFEWNYHRALYFWSDVEPDALGPQHRLFDCVTPACRAERLQLARKLKVKMYDPKFAGQVIPFRVWKDSYGQALIPETLGFVDYPFYPDHTWRPISWPDDLLRRAKLLRVVRGAYASFFWHPDLLGPNAEYYKAHPGNYETVGGKHTLIKLVEGIKALGYEFKSISDCSLFPRAACPPGSTTAP